jgi:hypothetical protein
MEIVQPLVVMVSKLSSEVHRHRIDNEILMTQLRELLQAPSPLPSTRRKAASSAIAINATAKSYRDVVCAVGCNASVAVVTAPPRNSLLEPTIVTGENISDGDFVTVARKKLPPKKHRVAMIGETLLLSLLCRRGSAGSLFLFLGFPLM